jgi:hypothetical protein
MAAADTLVGRVMATIRQRIAARSSDARREAALDPRPSPRA